MISEVYDLTQEEDCDTLTDKVISDLVKKWKKFNPDIEFCRYQVTSSYRAQGIIDKDGNYDWFKHREFMTYLDYILKMDTQYTESDDENTTSSEDWTVEEENDIEIIDLTKDEIIDLTQDEIIDLTDMTD